MAARSALAKLVVLVFAFAAAASAAVFGWYGFRVVSELGSGSWRTPTTILDRQGEPLLELYGAEWRRTDPIVLEDLPEHIPNAFLAAEDVRFRSHFGLDPIGLARAALTNVKAGGIAQGGSTITQQLAKTRFLTADRTFTRKGVEAVLAVLIEMRLSKDEILEAYLNDVYLGHYKGRQVIGVDEAARVYFDKDADELTIAESALLAGMIRAPNRDNPESNPDVARERRNAVLATMRDREWITGDEYDDAEDDGARFRYGSFRATPHPYLLAAIRAEVADHLGERRLRAGSLRIVTGIDAKMQKAAEEAVRAGTRRLRNRHRWLRRDEPLQAALLAVEPNSGAIRALVGGSSWEKSQFDRTRRMRRQPGSALKPFTYAAAIAERRITAATVLEDEPVSIALSRNDVWKPRNYDERYRGSVTVREAFEKSLNTTAVRVAEDVGVRKVRALLDDAQIEGELSDTPAIALGVDEVSMRELVGAYTIFPTLGRRTEPHLIEKIESSRGRSLWRFRDRPRRILDPAAAYVVHSLMRGVVQRGTASRLDARGLGYLAGKTGTTNDYRDAWFVGYAPDLLAATWVGFDDGTPLRISSAEAALPLWEAFMKKAPHEHADLAPPDGVRVVAIEPASGLRWQPGCGNRFDEVFLEGTEPEEKCAGRAEEPPLLVDFEEPDVITAEEFDRWLREAPPQVEIVIEPPQARSGDDPNVLSREEQEAIDRQIDEAVRREEADRDEDREDEPERVEPPAEEPPPSRDGEKLLREIEKAREKAIRDLRKQERKR
ncbi:MAG TPA: PBP1A family penicillin-binding protein, partial [Thermoanaerobaculia bacterium]|nr:PBP1A family penicillin-binding protein [Thermoanaerobaculia bacterium]